ncbi:MAG: hypothetical protein QOE24_1828 [Frankiales bacterium]|nr:hypothetical protein [Frankiales bacterium]
MDETLTTDADHRLLTRVSWLVQAQGLALSVVCLGFAIYALGGHQQHHGLAQTELEFGLGLLTGVVWTLLGRSLGAGSRGAYSPLLLLELICLPVSWGLGQGHLWVYSGLVGVPALVAVVALFSPAGRRIVTGDADDDG